MTSDPFYAGKIELFKAAVLDKVDHLRAVIAADPNASLDDELSDADLDHCSPEDVICLNPYPFNGLSHVAAMAGSANFLRELVAHTQQPDEFSSQGMTPLALAVRHGRADVVRQYCERADRHQMLGFMDRLRNTLLHMAADTGNDEIVSLLLEAGLSPEDQNDAGWTPHYYAIRPSKDQENEADPLAVVRLLMSHSSWQHVRDLTTKRSHGIPLFKGPETGAGWLHVAANAGNIQAMELMMADGFRVDERCDPEGGTPIHYACSGLQPSAIHMLAQRGADLNSEFAGMSLLNLATENRIVDTCLETVSTLLELGCDPTVPDSRGIAPIDLAHSTPQLLALYHAHNGRAVLRSARNYAQKRQAL